MCRTRYPGYYTNSYIYTKRIWALHKYVLELKCNAVVIDARPFKCLPAETWFQGSQWAVFRLEYHMRMSRSNPCIPHTSSYNYLTQFSLENRFCVLFNIAKHANSHGQLSYQCRPLACNCIRYCGIHVVGRQVFWRCRARTCVHVNPEYLSTWLFCAWGVCPSLVESLVNNQSGCSDMVILKCVVWDKIRDNIVLFRNIVLMVAHCFLNTHFLCKNYGI